MKKTLLFVLVCLASYAQQPQNFTQSNATLQGFSEERLNKLDGFLEDYVKDGKTPNAAIFIAKNGKIVRHKAFGYSNVEQKTALKKNDIFRIASQTKLLTTICVLMLMEEGKFNIDEPISKYLPSFKNPKILVSVDEKDPKNYVTKPAKNQISIRHLLSHSAGIPYEHALENLSEFKVPYFNSLEADNLETVVDKLAKRPLLSEPGESFVYGLNTDILGRLVEVVSGQKFDEFMRKRLIEPLNLTDTYFYLPESKYGRLVKLYEKDSLNKPMRLSQNKANCDFAISGSKTYFSGGAGLVSTVEDYAKVCQLILNKGRFNNKQILSRKTVEMMATNQIGKNTYWGREDGFGLGLEIASESSHYMDLASPGSLMWGGMYCSEYTIDPKENLIMLIFTNIYPYAHYDDLTRKFRILVYQALK